MAPNQSPAGAALLLRDLRSPAEPMRSFAVKLPDRLIEALDQHAAALSAPQLHRGPNSAGSGAGAAGPGGGVMADLFHDCDDIHNAASDMVRALNARP